MLHQASCIYFSSNENHIWYRNRKNRTLYFTLKRVNTHLTYKNNINVVVCSLTIIDFNDVVPLCGFIWVYVSVFILPLHIIFPCYMYVCCWLPIWWEKKTENFIPFFQSWLAFIWSRIKYTVLQTIFVYFQWNSGRKVDT